MVEVAAGEAPSLWAFFDAFLPVTCFFATACFLTVALMDAFALAGMVLTCPAVTFEVVAVPVVGTCANAGTTDAAANAMEAANIVNFFMVLL